MAHGVTDGLIYPRKRATEAVRAKVFVTSRQLGEGVKKRT